MRKHKIKWAIVTLLVSGSCALRVLAANVPTARPNIVIILADDMGYSDVGCYGGEIHTPNIDNLAKRGIRFAQFYNQARCCPTRAALLSGLYPHQAGVGAMNQNLGKPPYQGELNDKCVTIAEVLKGAGYFTGMAGKWHLCRLNVASSAADKAKAMLEFSDDSPISESKANWPCNRGFEEHWGTIPGVENYFDPYGLVHNEQTIKPDKSDFYYTDFITEHAVQMIDDCSQQNRSFFLYVAYTAPHWPMQARPQDIEPYKNTYSIGWDAIRDARYKRQIDMGLIDPQWGLSPRAFDSALNDGASAVGPWDKTIDPDWQAGRMAVYAAMVESLDRGVGKILDALVQHKIDHNTVVVFLSDNGGCQENVRPDWYDIPSRTRDGRQIHIGNDPHFMPGPEEVFQSYGPAWANASNTPFRRFKHFTEEGGIATPFIVSWPDVVPQTGTIQHNQVGDVIDLMPTVLDMAGVAYPTEYRGHRLTSLEGQSLFSVFKGGPPVERSHALCWEHEGNRAVRIDGWKLVAAHGERWRLFDMAHDRTELHDVAAQHPETVAKLHDAYDAWLKRVGVEEWPIKD